MTIITTTVFFVSLTAIYTNDKNNFERVLSRETVRKFDTYEIDN